MADADANANTPTQKQYKSHSVAKVRLKRSPIPQSCSSPHCWLMIVCISNVTWMTMTVLCEVKFSTAALFNQYAQMHPRVHQNMRGVHHYERVHKGALLVNNMQQQKSH